MAYPETAQNCDQLEFWDSMEVRRHTPNLESELLTCAINAQQAGAKTRSVLEPSIRPSPVLSGLRVTERPEKREEFV